MLRFAVAALFTVFAVSAAALAQDRVRAADTDRPGGTYVTLPSGSADDCEAACEHDGLCMAWTQLEQSCALKAVVSAPEPYRGAVSGLAARAPRFAALIAGQPAAAPKPAFAASAAAPPRAPMRSAHEEDLLGGPDAT